MASSDETYAEVQRRAAALIKVHGGDPSKIQSDIWRTYINMALDWLQGEMALAGVSHLVFQKTISVPSGTASLTLTEMDPTSIIEPRSLKERGTGETVWIPMRYMGERVPANAQPANRLRFWGFRNIDDYAGLIFVPATQDNDVLFEYVGRVRPHFDDPRDVVNIVSSTDALSYYAASLAAAGGKDTRPLSQSLRADADRRCQILIQLDLKLQQQRPFRQPRRAFGIRGGYGVAWGGPGGGGGGPTPPPTPTCEDTVNICRHSNDDVPANLTFKKSRGTEDVPLNLITSDAVGAVNFTSWSSDSDAYVSSGRIVGISNGGAPAQQRLEFQTGRDDDGNPIRSAYQGPQGVFSVEKQPYSRLGLVDNEGDILIPDSTPTIFEWGQPSLCFSNNAIFNLFGDRSRWIAFDGIVNVYQVFSTYTQLYWTFASPTGTNVWRFFVEVLKNGTPQFCNEAWVSATDGPGRAGKLHQQVFGAVQMLPNDPDYTQIRLTVECGGAGATLMKDPTKSYPLILKHA
jgi:hypothetical protein